MTTSAPQPAQPGRPAAGGWARAARWAGTILVVASLVFVASRVAGVWETLAASRPGPRWVGALALAACVYGVLGYLLSTAWHRLVRLFGDEPIPALESHRLYARSQIAKYLPGNVFHLASRHAMGRGSGSGHATLVAAASFEMMALLMVAAAVGLAGLGLLSLPAATSPGLLAVLLAGSLLAIVGLTAALPRLSLLQRLGIPARPTVAVGKGLAAAILLYLLYFLGSGALFVAVVVTVAPIGGMHGLGAVLAAFALSWIAGFVTPGASAGIGVREAALVITLSGLLGEPSALIAAIAFRLVTVGGDVLYFASSFLFRGTMDPPAAS